MADWTTRIHIVCATLGTHMFEPPASVVELPDIMAPTWARMNSFLNSGALAVANVHTKGRRGQRPARQVRWRETVALSGKTEQVEGALPAVRRGPVQPVQLQVSAPKTRGCPDRATGGGRGGKKRDNTSAPLSPAAKKAKKGKASANKAAEEAAEDAAPDDPDGDNSE